MAYLDDAERLEKCPNASMDDVEFASMVINAYIGKEIGKFEETQKINLSRKSKGKLDNIPVISIVEVKAVFRNMFGKSEEMLDPETIEYDREYGYFEFYPNSCSMNNVVFGVQPTTLVIKYQHGYETIPDDIKKVCALIADNTARANAMGLFPGVKQISDLNFSLVLFNENIVTPDVRLLLSKYKG